MNETWQEREIQSYMTAALVGNGNLFRRDLVWQIDCMEGKVIINSNFQKAHTKKGHVRGIR